MTKVALAALIDEYCELTERLGEDKKRQKELRKILLPHCDETKPLKTNRWCITYTKAFAETLDTKQIREEMPMNWLKKYLVRGVRETLKVTKL